MNTPTRLIDIPSTILAILIIIGGVVLFYVGKIAWVEFSFCLGVAAALIGGPVLLKAPSPVQAQQLSTLTDQAQAHDTQLAAHANQLQAQAQQLGQVQGLAVQTANGVAQLAAGVAAATPQTPVQGMVNLATMGTTSQPQFMQPVPPPVQVVDYGRSFGDSTPLTAMPTQKIPAA